MSEENTTEVPVLSLQKIYTKDVSFENPNAPEVFSEPSEQPKVEMNLALNSRAVNEHYWEVTLKVHVMMRDGDEGRVMFEVEVEQAGMFLIQHIPEEHMQQVLAVNCPGMIFPYIRQVVSQLTVDGGFMPFLMEPVNFQALLEQAKQEGQTIQ